MNFVDDDDDVFDRDIFEDENFIPENGISASFNPLHESLMCRLSEVDDLISEVTKKTCEFELTCDSMLKKIYKQCTSINALCTSDSETEWYDDMGAPRSKRVKQEAQSHIPINVNVINTWQRIIDDKWILGVELDNKTHWLLDQAEFYVTLENEKALSGSDNFWVTINDAGTLWDRTYQIHPDCKRICAVAIVNLPHFKNTTTVKAFGTILFIADGHEYRIPVSCFKLNALEAIDKTLSPRCAPEIDYSILAMKSLAMEKVMTISLEKYHSSGQKLLEFLEKKGFADVVTDTFVSRNGESFRHCLIEILSISTPELLFRISARTTAQLDIITRLITEECPGATEVERQDKLTARFTALENEMELKERSTDFVAMRRAEGKTDLLMIA